MSLGDFLRLQRARRGGITPWDIEEATQLPKGLYRQMEQRYRAIGDEDAVRMLADFYQLPFEDLYWRLGWSRKALSRALQVSFAQKTPISFETWDGEQATGVVLWWDLGAAAIDTDQGLSVVQRHAIERWSPRLDEPYQGAEEEDDQNDDEGG